MSVRLTGASAMLSNVFELQVDRNLSQESKELIKRFLELQPVQKQNEFNPIQFEDEKLIEIISDGNHKIEIALFFLGADIRRRIEFIRDLGMLELNSEQLLFKQVVKRYKEYSATQTGTIKTQIENYFKLQSIIELR